MATATVPAAVPDPNDPPNTSTGNGPSGLLASMLAPVEPARPATFDIPAPAASDGTAEEAVAAASSAAYHGTEEAAGPGHKSSTTIDKKSIWRAWLLAGAARWGKGGGAHNKRLDMLKAKAAAHQVKENRQVSVNRSSGLLPGKGNAGSNGSGKSGGGKGNSGGGGSGSSGASGKGPAKGPVKSQGNSNGHAHKGPAGRSGGGAGSGSGTGGRGAGGSAGGDGDSSSSGRGGAAPKCPKTDGSSGRDPKPSKADLTKGKDHHHGGGASGSKNGTTGPTGSSGKNGTSTNGGSAKGPSPAAASKDGKSPKATSGKGSADTKGGKASKTDLTKRPGEKPGKPDPAEAPTGKNPEPDSPATKTDKTPKDSKDSKAKDDKTAQPKSKAETRKQADGKKTVGKPFTTRESRATGYRDGIRAATCVAHAKAYCDGVKDGWNDVTEAADRQKAQLDKAHEKRKKAREAARDKEQDVSGAGTSADHHKPQPIEVKGVDADTVWLGEGADRNSLSRGEVRSLKHFERRLEAKATSMKKVAEGTKLLKAHAEAQSQKATALMEATKSVKGGEKLIASLVKTADAAKVQADLAEEIHKRAVRAADGCAAVLANAQTRYGAMYKAVVDSDEEVPGEMDFYKDGATTHG
ncbi:MULTISPECIES: hypothetical protein [unclassified Streptomyces]|uniref:hypothetical protein n=1 Tax=unclassified Streptomyces TaxID=2593676 RepID=UPI0008910A9B|nr:MULTISPECIES: hypothetical protein [unclassified Streptomyces]PBC72266.1 hypothetical protein BX261_7350 [Streptomyces sp. 2321.6]SDR61909.1 hypothetical protein SAMN05216511_7219 [Streptomyces sp. KS_16]SEE48830.1 hypothetical protein SAMN05428940_7268 [Streptomyces sp. 2133.1]SNC77771.1 hypothetical protein SAMN06272741_7187 [Streptomyces sp. 2114.4]